jgi:hypothetical protein
MLTAFARHGRFDLTVQRRGRPPHRCPPHDGGRRARPRQAFDEALGGREGIVRMGDALVPLDEALVQCVIDISGRPFAATHFDFIGEMIGDAPTEMVPTSCAPSPPREDHAARPPARRRQRPPHRGGHDEGARPRPRCRDGHDPRIAGQVPSMETHQGDARYRRERFVVERNGAPLDEEFGRDIAEMRANQKQQAMPEWPSS